MPRQRRCTVFTDRLKALTPYVPGEQPQDRTYIKLNTNESPYPPSPRVRQVLQSSSYEDLRLYPDPLFRKLRETIASRHCLKPANVFISNGSDEALSFCFYAFFDSSRGPLLFPEFSYSFYPVYCDFYRIGYKKIPLNPDFSINVDSYLAQKTSCGIIFPNPNAPTGIGLSLDAIKSLLDRYPVDRVVVIDEAYIDFGGESAACLLEQYPNLLIVQTYSKSKSLAGLRLGFTLGSEALITALFTVKDSFNSYPVDRLTLDIGKAAYEDQEYYSKMTGDIIRSREYLTEKLLDQGFEVLPSKANFVFARKPGTTGKAIYERLKEKGILVRYFSTPGIDDFVRITIGTPEEIDCLLKNTRALFGRLPIHTV
ncbi:MAG: histidinol-phosphate transaminase [Pseudomonadota bacterium]